MTITVNTCKDYLKSFWIKRVLLSSKEDEAEIDIIDENSTEGMDDKIIE